MFVLFLSMLIIGLRVSGFDFFSKFTETLQQILQHSDCSGFSAVSVLYDCRYGRIRGLGLSGYEYNTYHLCTAISHGSCHSALYSDILDTQLCVDRILLAPFHLASDDFAGTIMGMFMGMQVEYQFMAGVGIMIVKSLLLLSLFFFGSKYILDHKLEIE